MTHRTLWRDKRVVEYRYTEGRRVENDRVAMCGIAGILSFSGQPVDEHILWTMGERLSHRGPDDVGIEVDGAVGMSHRRLSVLDLSRAAHQPMWDEHRRGLLCYNGEVYNFRCIRDTLAQHGVEIRSSGDTEVLLQACLTFGLSECLIRLNGMFAIAYWDARERSLYLARDRMGIKPLYYTCSNGRVAFASEIKALLGEVRNDPDLLSLSTMLAGDALWDPHTPFRYVRSVMPGEIIRFDSEGEQTSWRYYRLSDSVKPELYHRLARTSWPDVTTEFDHILRDSVSMHMISDAPVAVLASGGVDSSLIATVGHLECPQLPLYHANVVGPDSELAAAEMLRSFLGLELHVAEVTAEQYVREMAAVTFYHESPSAYHPNDLPLHLVCQLARKSGIKVLLTGEGADELLLGYPWIIVAATQRRMRRTISRVETLFSWIPGVRMLGKAGNRILHNDTVDMFRAQRILAQREANECYGFIDDSLERSLAVESFVWCGSHLRSLLQRNDRMGMMNSLESRFPFLENEFVEWSLSLPSRFKLCDRLTSFAYRHPYRSNKLVLRRLAEQYLPRELSRRIKIGFPVDALSYFHDTAQLFARGFLAGVYGVHPAEMAGVMETASRGHAWNILATECFGRIFFLGDSLDSVAADLAVCARAS